MTSTHSRSCIYCGAPAVTRDHVPPRAILESPYPNNLRTVPSCRECNNGYSKDEEYFLILLAQVSPSAFLQARCADGGTINRALSRRPALHNRLINAFDVDDDEEDDPEDRGRIVIRPEHDRVERIIRKIALGLYVLRFGRVPAIGSISSVATYLYCARHDRPAPYFIAKFTEKFRSKLWVQTQRKVFSHIFVRDPISSSRVWCVMDIHESLWGVVHLPNPRSVKIRNDSHLWRSVEKDEGLIGR